MTTKRQQILVFLIVLPGLLPAQVRPGGLPPQTGNPGTLPGFVQDSARFQFPPPDSTPNPLEKITLSADAIDEQLDYASRDSMFWDLKNKQIHLFGQATVTYQTMKLEADYIVIDWEENTLWAKARPGVIGPEARPKFSERDQTFTTREMKYNFKTRKGIIYQAATVQEGMQVIGEKAKYISAGEDTTRSDVIFNQNAIFSTCDLPTPHYGIRSRKQKVIPEKVAVSGLSNLEIAGVPTPLFIPFAIFPLKLGKRTGLIFPNNYEFSEQWGFGLRGVGWYFPMNDYWDLSVTTNLYLKGTFGINASARYSRRYKYRGSLGLSFDYRRQETEGVVTFTPSMGLRWSHNQDAKAHPTRTFGGSINLQTNLHQSTVENDAESVLQGTLSSNMSYRQTFADGKFTLSAGFNHSQNTRTRQVTINFPNVTLQMQRIQPFKRKIRTGREKWYEKISLLYKGEIRNQISATDTTLFEPETLEEARYGIKHSLNTDVQFNVLKYFNLAPRIDYREIWYFNTLRREFDPASVNIQFDTIYNPLDSSDFTIEADTLNFGTTLERNVFGFQPLRLFNAGMSLTTKLFGTLQFKKGWLGGLRHTLTPSIGFSFTPDYTNDRWGYFRTTQKDIRGNEETYSIFQNGVFSDRPGSQGLVMAATFNINHNFEAKVWSKRDSAYKKVRLFRSLGMNWNYNFAADSLKWSQVRISGNTAFFNNMTTARFNATFDPYDVDENQRRINTLMLDSRGKLLRFVDANLSLSTSLTVRRLRDLFKGVDSDDRSGRSTSTNDPSGFAPPAGNQQSSPPPQQEALLDLFDNFSINHNFSLRRFTDNQGRDTTLVSAHSIDVRGNIQLTPTWGVRVGRIGYDFKSKRVTYPDFGFYRDLHCWEMGFNWQPRRGTYSFFIRVKPGRLGFINIPYQKNNADAFRRF